MKKEKVTTKERGQKDARSTLWGIVLFLVLLIIDQVTKAVADVYFSQADTPEFIPVIPGWINLCITYNRGISYGMGDDAPMEVKLAVIGLTAVMMIGFAIFYLKMDKRRSFMRFALVCVVAGGVGNLIDRVYYQVWDPTTLYGVRDMVDLSRFGFAVCNFADFFIVGGAIFLVLSLLFFDRDAIFPVGKYKALAKEQEAFEQDKKTKNKNGKQHG
ncbi:MAG: signal peptidase II [Clostridia bacterium]|nr:signal peptidase II [Clostridia bacterium]